MTTWNSADLVGVTLSNGDLTATESGGTAGDGVRSTTSISAGKVGFAANGVTGFAGLGTCVGVSLAGAAYDGSDANSWVLLWFSGFGYIVFNNGALAQGPDNTTATPTATDAVVVLLDSAGKLYFQVNGNNIFGADPAAGTGGCTIPTGSYFATASFNTVSAEVTADFTPGSLPSGYSDWDGGGGGGSPYTLTAAQGSFAVNGQTANLSIGPSWTFVGKTEAGVSASGNYTLTEPAGVQQDDILVVDFATRSNVIYTNSDWTFVQDDTTGNTTNNTTGSIVSYQTGYCIRGASPPSYTFNRTGGSRCLGTVRAYRSSRTGTPSFDTSAEVAMGSAGTTVTLTGGVTTTDIDELLVTAVYGARANTVSNMNGVTEVTGNSGATDTTTPPVLGTWTERSDRNNGTSPTVALACYDTVKRTAGSTGNLTATESQSARHGMTAMAFKHPTVAGPAGYTLTADKGSFSLSGQAATLRRTRTFTAAQGNLSLTGQAATLKRGFTATASQGSFLLSGQAATLSRSRVFTVSQGSFSLTGQVANLKRTVVFPAGQGSYSLTGQSAGLAKGYKTTANQGTYTLSGQNNILRYARKFTVDQGSFAITGNAANLVKASALTLVASFGSFALTGQSVNLIYPKKITADQGSYTLTGQAANLRYPKTLPVDQASFVISGQAATLRRARNLITEKGDYFLTGFDATLSKTEAVNKILTAETGSFSIAGKAAELRYGLAAGGLTLIRQHYTKVKSHPPKLPPRQYVQVHPITIKEAAAHLASVGGAARAASLNSTQRKHIAKVAAKARWG